MKKEILDIAARLQLGELSEYEAKWELKEIFRSLCEDGDIDESKRQLFCTGTRLKVIKHGVHSFEIGEEVAIIDVDTDDETSLPYLCEGNDGSMHKQWLRRDEVKLARE